MYYDIIYILYIIYNNNNIIDKKLSMMWYDNASYTSYIIKKIFFL
jgi:hypothetical protein